MKLSLPTATFVSSGFGSGRLLRKGPGTVGSIAALGFWWTLSFAGAYSFALQIIAFSIIVGLGAVCVESVLAAGDRDDADPSWVVIDEWAGMGLAITMAQPYAWWGWASIFGLFRLFDILKPGLVARAERLPGAVGVMSDDILAGALAAGVYYILLWFV